MVSNGSNCLPLPTSSLGDPILGALKDGGGEGERVSEVRLELEFGFTGTILGRWRTSGTSCILRSTEAFVLIILPSDAGIGLMGFGVSLFGLFPFTLATLLRETFFSVFSFASSASIGLLFSLLLPSDAVGDRLC